MFTTKRLRSPLLGAATAVAAMTMTTAVAVPAQAATGAHWVGRVASSDHSVTVRSGPGTNYKAVGSVRGNKLISGYISGAWLKTSKGYVNRDVAFAYQKSPASYNGRMPRAMLSPIPTWMNSSWSGTPGYTPRTTRYLRTNAAKSLLAMNAAYKKRFGTNLKLDLGYRSYAEQRYWSNKLGYPRAARPGTSNHGWGLAIDLWENKRSPYRFGQPSYNWLISNGSKFGFTQPSFMRQRGSNPEYWHLNYTG